MPRGAFRSVVGHVLWKADYQRRFQVCAESARLTQIADEMSHLAEEDSREGARRTRWPGAPCLPYVDSKYHVRLLAMVRLGTLPVEIETGRWENKPRAARLCRLGCDEVGDVAHFCARCSALSAERVPSLARSAVTTGASSPHSYWRSTARKLECRWRERTHALRTTEAEPLHPADAQDDEFSKLLDGGVEQQSATDAVGLSNRKLSSKNEVRPLPKSTPAAREARKGGKKQRKAQPKAQRRPGQQ